MPFGLDLRLMGKMVNWIELNILALYQVIRRAGSSVTPSLKPPKSLNKVMKEYDSRSLPRITSAN